MIEKPSIVGDEHLTYLDNLRKSSVTNMFAAAPYVVSNFDCSKKEADVILLYWMESFDERHSS